MFTKEFDERTSANMEVALERACARLAANENDYQSRRVIAEKIIECARGGGTSLTELTVAGIKAIHLLKL